MVTPRLKELLDRNHVPYQSIPHAEAYDAQRTAEAAHVPGREFAKAVIVRADERLCMAVLPASDRVDLERLRRSLGARDLELADEDEIRETFPDCDIGALPPFGELYGMEVFVSPHLREDERIAFNAGSHDEALAMQYRDYERLVRPTVLAF
jgi:Ala-tRNA(Pro) deacylase